MAMTTRTEKQQPARALTAARPELVALTGYARREGLVIAELYTALASYAFLEQRGIKLTQRVDQPNSVRSQRVPYGPRRWRIELLRANRGIFEDGRRESRYDVAKSRLHCSSEK